MPVPEEFPAQKQDEGSEAPPVLGKRAQAARASALMAGAQVMRKITFENVKDSFPDLANREGGEDAIQQITAFLISSFQESLAQYWDEHVSKPRLSALPDSDFNHRANALDEILDKARARRGAGEQGSDLWLEASNPVSRLRRDVGPDIQAEIDALRARKQKLDKQNEKKATELIGRRMKQAALENECRSIMDGLRESLKEASSVDLDELQKFQDELDSRLSHQI